jgi:hypothetical protein
VYYCFCVSSSHLLCSCNFHDDSCFYFLAFTSQGVGNCSPKSLTESVVTVCLDMIWCHFCLPFFEFCWTVFPWIGCVLSLFSGSFCWTVFYWVSLLKSLLWRIKRSEGVMTRHEAESSLLYVLYTKDCSTGVDVIKRERGGCWCNCEIRRERESSETMSDKPRYSTRETREIIKRTQSKRRQSSRRTYHFLSGLFCSEVESIPTSTRRSKTKEGRSQWWWHCERSTESVIWVTL